MNTHRLSSSAGSVPGRKHARRRHTPRWQSLLNWFSPEQPATLRKSGGGRAPLRFEALEERTVLATDINFNAGTGVLTLTVGAAETVNLDVAAVADFNIASDAGVTISGAAASLGFTAEGSNVVSDGSLATVNRIDIVGSGGVQTVNFNGGIFSAVNVDAAGSIENVNFTAATTFSDVSGLAPNANANITAGASLTQVVGATLTATDGGNVSLALLNGNLAVTSAISSTGGNGNVSLAAEGNVTLGAAVSVVGAGTVTIEADSDNDGAGFFASAAGGNIVTAGGDATVTGQDVDLVGTINVGAGDVELRTQTGGAISLGTDGALADDFGVTNVDLNLITAAVVRVGDAAAGNISVTAPIAVGATVPTLSLITSGTVSQSAAASLSVANLAISAGGGVTLQEANDVDNLAANVTGSGNSFVFVDADALNIATVDAVAGITTSISGGAFVALQSGAGVTQAASAAITTGGLVLTGTGPVTLNLATNNAATIAANIAGALSYRDADALAVGTVNGTVGIATAGNDASLQTGGTLAIGQAVVLGVGDLTLNAAAAVTQTAAVTAAGLELLGAGAFNLDLATNNVTTLAANVTGAVDYRDVDALVVGTVNTTVGVTTSNEDVSLQTGGTLSISQAVNAGLADVTLDAAAAVNQTAAITAAGLELLGAGSFTLNLATNNVATLAANATGSVSYRDSNALAIGTVNGTAGVAATGAGATIDVVAGNALTVANNVTAAGDVDLSAGTSLAAGDNLNVNAGATVQSTAADVTLVAGDLVSVALGATVQAAGAGTVSLTGGVGETDGGGGVTVLGSLGTLAGTTVNISGDAGADVFTLNPSAAPLLITVSGQAANDTFNITPKIATAFTIDGGAPVVAPGDTLNIDFTGTTGATLTPGVPGAGQFTFTNRQTVTFTSIENAPVVPSAPGTAILVPDPAVPGQNTLLVTGTAANDRIIIDLVNKGTQIRVRIIRPGPDLKQQFDANTINKIVVFGQAGNDHISVSGRIFVNADLHGEAGNDKLQGGSGNDLLRGGADNDSLKGGKGNDLLLGEAGNDKLNGQAGFDILIGGLAQDLVNDSRQENILIGGTTTHDNNDTALRQLMAQWSGPGTFQQRTDALVPVLNVGTVPDDAAIDRLISGSNSDWFLDFAGTDKKNVKAGRDRLN